MARFIQLVGVLASCSVLASCAFTEVYSNKKLEQTTEEVQSLSDEAKKYRLVPTNYSAIQFDDNFYVPPVEKIKGKLPTWFETQAYFNKANMTLAELNNRFAKHYGVNVVTVDISQEQLDNPFSLDIDAPLGDVVKAVSHSIGIGYRFSDDVLEWNQFVEKTFELSFSASTFNYLLGQEDNETDSQSTQSSFGFGQAPQTQSLDDGDSYANIGVESLDPFAALSQTLDILKSSGGRYSLDRQNGLLTVLDRPRNVARIEKYLDQLDARNFTNVVFDFSIIEWSSSKGNLARINWDAVEEELAIRGVGGRATLASNFNSSVLESVTSLSLGIGATRGDAEGSEALIQALEQQGTVSVLSEPSVLARNNRPSTIRIGGDEVYVASSGSSSTNVQASNQLQPGILSLGTDVKVVPTVNLRRNLVAVELGLDIVELESIETFGSADNSQIQTPVTTNRELVLNFTAKSGESILISGYRSKRTEADSESSGLFWGLLGGSKSHSEQVTEVLILITPKIVSPAA